MVVDLPRTVRSLSDRISPLVRHTPEGTRKAYPVARYGESQVQSMRNSVQLTLRIARQIRAFRQVLAQQAIGVLSGPALTGAVRISKEYRMASRWARRSCSAISLPRS